MAAADAAAEGKEERKRRAPVAPAAILAGVPGVMQKQILGMVPGGGNFELYVGLWSEYPRQRKALATQASRLTSIVWNTKWTKEQRIHAAELMKAAAELAGVSGRNKVKVLSTWWFPGLTKTIEAHAGSIEKLQVTMIGS